MTSSAKARPSRYRGVTNLVVVSGLSALLGAGLQRAWQTPVVHHRDLAVVASRQNRTIAELEAALHRLRRHKQVHNVAPTPSTQEVAPRVVESKAQRECETKFGQGLVESYRGSRRLWCDGKTKMECYHHKYDHDGRVGLFCVATDVIIDFAKVKKIGKYLQFEDGATVGDCAKTNEWQQTQVMNHAKPQFRTFRTGSTLAFDVVEEAATTYLMARDEDCENMFHSTADHMNAFLVGRVLELDWSATRTLLWDGHGDGPFKELIQRSFSPTYQLQRPSDYKGKKVKFPRLIFHLESPAGIVFPKVAGPKGIMRCRASSLWMDFKNSILEAFNLLDVPPPANPSVILSVRRRTPAKNVGRVFADEEALEAVIRRQSAHLGHFEVLDLATLSFRDQLEKLRSTNVLIGAHGAGLMHVIFLADEAVLVEIHPSYRVDRHFRLAARMADKIYLPLRSSLPVTCSGSSDAIAVDTKEFHSVLDAAVRLARSFDNGVAECGLNCPNSLLALDPDGVTLVPPGTTPLSTRFPCK